jgi:hypothetical protein
MLNFEKIVTHQFYDAIAQRIIVYASFFEFFYYPQYYYTIVRKLTRME